MIRRGRAAAADMGVLAGIDELQLELTLTAAGAYASPVGPTVRDGRLDTDLLLTRTTSPVSFAAAALMRVAGARTGAATRASVSRDARSGVA